MEIDGKGGGRLPFSVYCLCSLMALTILFVLLSSLAFCKEITAQMAAGIHPIRVIWRMRQIRPVSIRPLSRNDNQGNKIAIKVMTHLSFLA